MRYLLRVNESGLVFPFANWDQVSEAAAALGASVRIEKFDGVGWLVIDENEVIVGSIWHHI